MHFQFTVYDALNGLFLFLLVNINADDCTVEVCQRPKRAFLISTNLKKLKKLKNLRVCQRPKRAFLISTKV